jgi:predicted lipoprotein with Yx(FWY)xxD motif
MKYVLLKGIVGLAMVFLVGSCKKDYNGTTGTPVNPSGNDIQVASSNSLGSYLTDKQGEALYMFANDADDSSTCMGDCQTTWPAFTVDLMTAQIGAGLAAADFATISSAGGKKQVTYKRWPLYRYSPVVNDGYGNSINKPELPGATGGEGMNGLRFVAKPDYSIMLANKQLKGMDGAIYKSDYTPGAGNTTYFTDGSGNTLYSFVLDSFNINKFTNPDLSNNTLFPIYEQDQVVVPSILNKSLFASFVFSGKKQMTYNGWPLYHFGGDNRRGSNQGITVPTIGVWPVAVMSLPVAKKK